MITFRPIMREARNPRGSTPSFGRAPIVRFETCAYAARTWQPKNLSLIALLAMAALANLAPAAEQSADLERQFQTPPASARPWVYWFWMNGNITRAGITADLEAMHDVGIGGCLIMHVKLGDIGAYKLGQMPPDGPVEFMSAEFRKLFQHAVTEAQRLGMTIDMNNADGFTGSGGPWIPVEKSMKKLVWSETHVHGPATESISLPHPEAVMGYYRDVAVVAYPRQPSLAEQMQAARATWSAPDPEFNARLITDRDTATRGLVWRRGGPGAPRLVISFPQAYTADTLVLQNIGIGRGTPVATLETSDDGTAFRPVGKVSLKWYPAAPTNTIRFDATAARYYRLTFAPNCQSVSIGELKLGRSNKIHYWEAKAGFTRYGEWGGGSELYTDRKTTPAGGRTAKSSPVSSHGNAAIRRDAVIDLTKSMGDDGRLTWDAPNGDWTILRIGCTSTGIKNHPASRGGHGLECDKLDPSGVDAAFDGMLGKLVADTGHLAGRAFGLAHVDSWEVGIQNWTETMPAEFARRNGYELARFYPLLVAGHAVQSNDVSERFLWDLRRTLLAMIAENYLGRMETLCHKHGLKFSSEAAGRQQFLHNPMYLLTKSDLPMGEFWPHEQTPRVDGKAAASVAHLYAKPRVGAEAFTGAKTFANWQAHPYRLKQIGDDAFCLGINQFVIHYSVHQAYRDFRPGFVMGPWGIHLDRMNTWWHQAKPWLAYLARCQYLLRQGRFVADVLYFPGEDVPHYFGKRTRLSLPLPDGFDFDGCDRETLLHRVRVEQGRLVLANGMQYRYLMLPDAATMTPAVAARIRELVLAGATVIGPVATRSPSLHDYPDCDSRVAQSFAQLADHGRFIWGKSFDQIAHADGLAPDFSVRPDRSAVDVRYIHRRRGADDIYFVANHAWQPVDFTAAFRVQRERPAVWDPETGTVTQLAVYTQRGAQTWLPLHLAPLQSVFVFFSPGAARSHIVAVSRNGAPLFDGPSRATGPSAAVPVLTVGGGKSQNDTCVATCAEPGDYAFQFADGTMRSVRVAPQPQPVRLSGPWTVSFPAGWGAPATVVLNHLISWTRHSDFGVKHFSGTARYRCAFSWQPSERQRPLDQQTQWLLDLGDVQVIARVKVNGQDKGLLWKPPFSCDVTDALKPGTNQLEVRVTNLWPNRLIGDEQFPDDASWEGIYLKSWPDWFLWNQPRPEPRRKTFTVVKHYTKNSPLLPSGLLGPVILHRRSKVRFVVPGHDLRP